MTEIEIIYPVHQWKRLSLTYSFIFKQTFRWMINPRWDIVTRGSNASCTFLSHNGRISGWIILKLGLRVPNQNWKLLATKPTVCGRQPQNNKSSLCIPLYDPTGSFMILHDPTWSTMIYHDLEWSPNDLAWPFKILDDLVWFCMILQDPVKSYVYITYLSMRAKCPNRRYNWSKTTGIYMI
jgi:hypothetical protein